MDFVAIVACVLVLAGSFAFMATRRKPMWIIKEWDISEYSFVGLSPLANVLSLYQHNISLMAEQEHQRVRESILLSFGLPPHIIGEPCSQYGRKS